MIDRRARPIAERLLAPLARAFPVHPTALTVMGLVVGGAAAGAAAASLWPLALVAWLTNRLLDGLDGLVARNTERQTDLGGYVDILCDVAIYAALPIGIALGQDDQAVWIATAALLASFYLNATSWIYLSALLEKRSSGISATGESTSVTMPPGLVEGAETIVWFAVMLIVPDLAVWTMAIMATAVLLTVALRLRAAGSLLRSQQPVDVAP